jgi:creatinine amidohydrolase
MNAGELRAVIIPVAAIEQHLEHMAMEHDWRSVNVVAEKIAQALSPNVLVACGVMAGISEHHMSHPGTLTLRPATFQAVLNDLIRSVVKAGFENVLVLNGHGGNVGPIGGVWDQFLREFQGVNLHFRSYWDVYTQEDADELLDSGNRLPQDLPGHAQEFETSVGLAAFPENVRTEMWTDQEDQKPAMATAEKGNAFLDRAVERNVEILREIMTGERTSESPPFFP